MRLALLGPAEGHLDALEAAMRFLLEARSIDRAVYLGVDGALDAVVHAWAGRLVGDNPSEVGVWARAVRACLRATPAEIDGYIRRERERAALRMFEALLDADTRSIEMLGGALAVMIHDKAHLNEEDMLPARLLLFGKSSMGVVKQVGQRWFLSPGSFAGGGGIMTLDDEEDGVFLTLYDRDATEIRTEHLSIERATKLKVGSAGQ